MKIHCIICNQIKEHSKEHIVPDAIGGNIVINEVCKDCNSKLGDSVDALLTEDDFCLYARHKIGVKNRDNKLPNVFNSKYGWVDNDNKKVIIKHGKVLGENVYYDGTQKPEAIIHYNKQNNRLNIQYSGSDLNSIMKIIHRELNKNNISLTYDDINKLIDANGFKVTKSYTNAIHLTTYKIEDYIPCILKIAYEFSYYKFGELYRADNIGCYMRKYLFYKAMDKQPTVPFWLIVIKTALPAPDVSNFHLLNFIIRKEKLFLDIFLFGSIIFRVLISCVPEKYQQYFELEEFL